MRQNTNMLFMSGKMTQENFVCSMLNQFQKYVVLMISSILNN